MVLPSSRRPAALVTSTFLLVVAGAAVACTGEDASTRTPFEDAAATASELCGQMCTKAMTQCTGAQTIYADEAQCVATCKALDLGVAGSGAGNTIRCRIAQLQAGNCSGGGVLGGNVCGAPCDGFCKVTSKACSAATQVANPFGDEGTCLETCRASLRFDPNAAQGGDISLTSDTLNCRAQHLLLATKDPDPHCGHLKVPSPVCTAP
jgi:hypothetical protein